MNERFDLSVIGTGIISTLTFIFGGFDVAFKVLVIMMCFDMMTGIVVGGKSNSISSKICYSGIAKKFGIIVVVAVSNLISIYTGLDWARPLVIGFYITNEGISITENLCKMGVKIPKFLKEKLLQLNEDFDDGTNIKKDDENNN